MLYLKLMKVVLSLIYYFQSVMLYFLNKHLLLETESRFERRHD